MALGKLFCFRGPKFPPRPKELTSSKVGGGLNEILYVPYQEHAGDSENDANDCDTFRGN